MVGFPTATHSVTCDEHKIANNRLHQHRCAFSTLLTFRLPTPAPADREEAQTVSTAGLSSSYVTSYYLLTALDCCVISVPFVQFEFLCNLKDCDFPSDICRHDARQRRSYNRPRRVNSPTAANYLTISCCAYRLRFCSTIISFFCNLQPQPFGGLSHGTTLSDLPLVRNRGVCR